MVQSQKIELPLGRSQSNLDTSQKTLTAVTFDSVESVSSLIIARILKRTIHVPDDGWQSTTGHAL